MTDLVQRLSDQYSTQLHWMAADRIEQLEREERNLWKKWMACGSEVARLERENAELRKQLQAEHKRQHRVWAEIQSQHRDHSPLSMKEQP